MPALTNTIDTYDFGTAHLREDLADIIFDVSRRDAPFINLIGKTKATSRTHDWVTDSLGSAAANAQVEGDETTFDTYTAPSRLTNATQIFRKAYVVSGTSIAVDIVGAEDEYTRMQVKAMRQLMRDMELAAVSNNAPVTGNASTARVMRPLMGWFSSNVSRASDGSNGTTSAAATDGTLRDFSKDLVDTVMQSIRSNSSEMPSVLMCAPAQRKNISAMSISNVTRQTELQEGKLPTSVKVVETDFADLRVVDNDLMRSRDIVILNPDFWALAELRSAFSESLGKSGDAEKFQVIAEATLESRNEAANGVIADLNA
jgi:hypothetical protein